MSIRKAFGEVLQRAGAGLAGAAPPAAAAASTGAAELAFGGQQPQGAAAAAFVAPNAALVGSVSLGAGASVWYDAVLRADVNAIQVGAGAQIGDRVTVHVAKFNGDFPAVIGERARVGAGATVHACRVDADAVIGEGATVLDGAVVEAGARVAPGATVTPGTVVKAGQLWAGVPAQFVRDLTPYEDAEQQAETALLADLARVHAAEAAKPAEQVAAEAEERAVEEWNTDLTLHPSPVTQERPGVFFDSDYRGPDPTVETTVAAPGFV